MVNDRESQLYKDMADLTEIVPNIQKEIKSVKGKFTKLSNRIDSLELMTFQDQINRLSDRIDDLSRKFDDLSGEHFIWMQRKLSEFIIVSTVSQVNHLLISKKHKDALEQLNISAAATHAKVQISDTPLEDATKFYNDCLALAEQSGIKCIKLDYP